MFDCSLNLHSSRPRQISDHGREVDSLQELSSREKLGASGQSAWADEEEVHSVFA